MSESINPLLKEQSFEECFGTLEKKVAVLENGGMNFADTMEAYKDAAESVMACLDYMKEAKLIFECYDKKIADKLKECDV